MLDIHFLTSCYNKVFFDISYSFDINLKEMSFFYINLENLKAIVFLLQGTN